MPRKGKSPAVALAIALPPVALALALAFVSHGRADGPRHEGPGSTFTLEQAQAVSDRQTYFAGDNVDGLPLVAVLRRTGTADFVSFVYGDCDADGGVGCAPPAEVQVWPSCKRSLGLYDQSRPGTPIPESTTVRGVPAAFFEDGLRLEIHTGKSLVVIFSDSRERVKKIASALEGLNVSVSRGAPLAKPVAGAVDGKLPC